MTENDKVFMIGVSGGSASGKSSVSQLITKNLGTSSVCLICMDSFYKNLSPEDSKKALESNYNFDHPNSFDFDLLYSKLVDLKNGLPVDIPIYDFVTHSRSQKEVSRVEAASVVIFEGILSFHDERVRDLMDLKLFVDTDDDVRLSRRLLRDISERGRDTVGVLQQYNRFVKPCFDQFIRPTKVYADIIIPKGCENTVAIDLISNHIATKLHAKDYGFKDSLNQFLSKSQSPLQH